MHGTYQREKILLVVTDNVAKTVKAIKLLPEQAREYRNQQPELVIALNGATEMSI